MVHAHSLAVMEELAFGGVQVDIDLLSRYLGSAVEGCDDCATRHLASVGDDVNLIACLVALVAGGAEHVLGDHAATLRADEVYELPTAFPALLREFCDSGYDAVVVRVADLDTEARHAAVQTAAGALIELLLAYEPSSRPDRGTVI